MNIKRSVIAACTAIAIAAGAVPANAADVTPEQAAAGAAQGVVKQLTSVPHAVTTGKPQTWLSYVDGKTILAYDVYSPSMDRDIPVAVVPAKDANGNRIDGAPTVYMLNGAGGAEQDADWLRQTEQLKFYQDKGVNVVIPQAGAFSYYTDWVTEDLHTPYLKGPQKWETFLTKELPGPIERELKADNRRAIVGFSMSATSALLLPEHNPGFYDAAASFSGCAATSSPLENQYLKLTLQRGGATPEMMWGPMGSPTNRYNDALLNADKLRGTDLYISSATGLASQTDTAGYLIGQGANPQAASAGAAVLQIEGGIIEAAVNKCTHDMKAKLDHLDIPAHFELRNTGTHSWAPWRLDMEKSWFQTIAPAFGM
ncbi:alpha/beta hydrolase family protein [Corynebacterium breve]|uniref:Alpha/beta hydrolase family protein n=1 Tax=Corynebacterium breve TaxID=3049799 RepID=A0ABY8VJ27_9CORY|nr:alpha/beta hydrolase family protein [Corynebacterium breve]WIM68976.1 alpha/beta hydrolase family protein [Corynebacterium breve]